MKCVKCVIFGGLVRNPPTAVDGFIGEATNIEQPLNARANHWLNDVSALASARSKISTSTDELREINCDIVREELKKLLPAADHSESLAIAEVV